MMRSGVTTATIPKAARHPVKSKLSSVTTGRHDARLMPRLAWPLLLCLCAMPAWAQYDSGDFDVEQADRVWLRALLDVRLVRGGPAPSWTDSGIGKLRYGGKQVGTGPDAHFERVTRLALAQLAIEVGCHAPRRHPRPGADRLRARYRGQRRDPG